MTCSQIAIEYKNINSKTPEWEKNNLDGGNLTKHLTMTHQWTKEQVAEYKDILKGK
jgi:tellurite resistance-related uncharacterized protein